MRRKKGASGWMAIKVDLEKAFDRLRWDFIHDTLIDAGLPNQLISLIMNCITTPSMQVLWNGAASAPFSPQWGVSARATPYLPTSLFSVWKDSPKQSKMRS